MKKFILILSLMGLLGLGSTACAQSESTVKPPKKEKAVETPAVPAALKKLKTFNGKLNKKAQYYVYLQSASWCGPCREEMPKIVEAYKEMKKRGVEIILFSCDRTEEAAKNYAKEFKMKFPITTQYTKLKNPIPGFTEAQGIPAATIVDENGKVLISGHGSIIMKWEAIINQAEQNKKAEEEKDEE